MFFLRKKFPSAEELEKEEKQKVKLYQEFVETQNSDIVKEYFELHDEVTSPTFKVEKDKIQKVSYKKTDNFRKEKEFAKLEKNRSLKKYFEIEKSSGLKDYLSFKDTEEFKDIYNSDKRKKSVKLANMYKFENSKPYKNYKEVNGSPILKQYFSLKEFLASEEHKTFKTYCNDSKRWEKTDLFNKEKRFNELAKLPAIVHYLKYKDTPYFDEQKQWELAFTDTFNTGQLESEKWLTSYYWVKDLGGNLYTSANELQAYDAAKNITVSNNLLNIKTKKQTGKGKFWDPKHGFVVKQTPFTSGIICSQNSFEEKSGKIKVKVKLNGNPFIHHSVWLGNQKNDQSVVLFKTDSKKFLVGTVSKTKTGLNKATQAIKNIPVFGKYYILSVEWNEKSIIWKVNDYQIRSSQNNLKASPMHLIMNSTVTDSKKADSGEMIIDWVKSYSKKTVK